MKQIAILSGKGGTGKTTITASFAVLAHNAVIADCDVDAADLHLILDPHVNVKQEFKGSKLAVIDKSKCSECDECERNCRFNAIKDFVVDPVLCEGCGVCVYVCPEKAIRLEEKVSGYAFISETRYGPMAHARLNTAESNSGKLVSLVRQNAKQLAEKGKRDLILIDGPPGIGCPVIASLTGVDLTLIITEPTMSGIHDLQRVLEVAKHFGVTSAVCINMYDINIENTERIAEFCNRNNIETVGKIPFNPIVTEAMVAGKPVVEYSPKSGPSNEIREMWNKVRRGLE